jgi:hypothetical protein
VKQSRNIGTVHSTGCQPSMPQRTSQTPFGLAKALMAVHTSYLSCGKVGKAPKFAPVRESSGQTRVN